MRALADGAQLTPRPARAFDGAAEDAKWLGDDVNGVQKRADLSHLVHARWRPDPKRLEDALVMESLVYLLRSTAFFVPGALGVMEGGYILRGPVFGPPAEMAMSLALVKRRRDFAIGSLAIAAWQILEGR